MSKKINEKIGYHQRTNQQFLKNQQMSLIAVQIQTGKELTDFRVENIQIEGCMKIISMEKKQKTPD